MKRFYCTVCKKVKRVRKFPLNIQSPDSVSPTGRIGSCNYHNPSYAQFKSRNLVGMSGKVAR